jgi:hypothetical protein
VQVLLPLLCALLAAPLLDLALLLPALLDALLLLGALARTLLAPLLALGSLAAALRLLPLTLDAGLGLSFTIELPLRCGPLASRARLPFPGARLRTGAFAALGSRRRHR